MHKVHLGYFKGRLIVYWTRICLINMSTSSVDVYERWNLLLMCYFCIYSRNQVKDCPDMPYYLFQTCLQIALQVC